MWVVQVHMCTKCTTWSPWIGLDNRWSSGGEMGSETERPANIPPPPKPANEIPMFQLGEKKKESEEESQPEG